MPSPRQYTIHRVFDPYNRYIGCRRLRKFSDWISGFLSRCFKNTTMKRWETERYAIL